MSESVPGSSRTGPTSIKVKRSSYPPHQTNRFHEASATLEGAEKYPGASGPQQEASRHSMREKYLSESPELPFHEDKPKEPLRPHERSREEHHGKPQSASPVERRNSHRGSRKRNRSLNDETPVKHNEGVETRANWWEVQSVPKRNRFSATRASRLSYDGAARPQGLPVYGERGNRFFGEGMNNYFPPFGLPPYDMMSHSMGVPWNHPSGMPYPMGLPFRPVVNPSMWFGASNAFANSWRSNAMRSENFPGLEPASYAGSDSEKMNPVASRGSEKVSDTSEHPSSRFASSTKPASSESGPPLPQVSQDPRFPHPHSYPMSMGYFGWGNTWNRFPADVPQEFMAPHRMMKAFNPSMMYSMMPNQRFVDPRYSFAMSWTPPYMRSSGLGAALPPHMRMYYPSPSVLSRRWPGGSNTVRGPFMGGPPVRCEKSIHEATMEELFTYLDKATSSKTYNAWDPEFSCVAYSQHLTDVFLSGPKNSSFSQVTHTVLENQNEDASCPKSKSSLTTDHLGQDETRSPATFSLNTEHFQTSNPDHISPRPSQPSTLDSEKPPSEPLMCNASVHASCIKDIQQETFSLLTFGLWTQSDDAFPFAVQWDLSPHKVTDVHMDLNPTVPSTETVMDPVARPWRKDSETTTPLHQKDTSPVHPRSHLPITHEPTLDTSISPQLPQVPSHPGGLSPNHSSSGDSDATNQFVLAYLTYLFCSSPSQFFSHSLPFMAFFNTPLSDDHWFSQSQVLGRYTVCITRRRTCLLIDTHVDSGGDAPTHLAHLPPVFPCALDRLENPMDITRFAKVPCIDRTSTNEALEAHLIHIVNQ